jgi:hypothetical protein
MGRAATTTTNRTAPGSGGRSGRRRAGGLLAAVALAAGLLSGVAATPASAAHDFPDVPASSPFHHDISWLAEGGYAHGYHDGTFRPAAPVSRQAFVAMLHRLDTAANGGGHHGHDETGADPGRMDEHVHPFPDVAMSNPFHDDIVWAAEEGLVNGYPDGTFRPAAPVSRQAAVAVLHRLSGLGHDYHTTGFTDVPPGHAFRTAIAWADMTNLADGYEGVLRSEEHTTATTIGAPLPLPVMPAWPTFEPTRPVSRQALAALLSRFDDMMGHHWPAADHHGHECTAPVTEAQQAAADQLVVDVVAGIGHIQTRQDALDAGYRYLAPPFGGAGAHYIHLGYMTDGLVLDPGKPESLMVNHLDEVEGAMFIMEAVGEPGPMVGGCLTMWHAHDNLCYTDRPLDGGTVQWLVDMGGCPAGTMLRMTPEMLHVYVDGRPNPFEGLET